MGAAIKYTDALKKEVTTAAFIPYSSHVTKNAVKLANGDYIQTIKMQGAAHESHGETVLNLLTSVSQYNLPRILCHSQVVEYSSYITC